MAEDDIKKSTKYVTVACKVPNGLRLRVFKAHTEVQQDRNGTSHNVTVNYPVGEPIVVNGPRPLSAQTTYAMPGGYTLTPNIPSDFWESWLEANKDSMMVMNNQIFASSSPESATKQALEQESIKSNLEPLDPSTVMKGKFEVNVDPRWPKAMPTSGVSPIQTGSRTA